PAAPDDGDRVEEGDERRGEAARCEEHVLVQRLERHPAPRPSSTIVRSRAPRCIVRLLASARGYQPRVEPGNASRTACFCYAFPRARPRLARQRPRGHRPAGVARPLLCPPLLVVARAPRPALDGGPGAPRRGPPLLPGARRRPPLRGPARA